MCVSLFPTFPVKFVTVVDGADPFNKLFELRQLPSLVLRIRQFYNMPCF